MRRYDSRVSGESMERAVGGWQCLPTAGSLNSGGGMGVRPEVGGPPETHFVPVGDRFGHLQASFFRFLLRRSPLALRRRAL